MGDELATMTLLKLALFASLLAAASADAPAAATLPTMVQWIKSGKFANNFFHGDWIQKPYTELQEVGGCLLDKVGAIQDENGLAEFPNDLKVDIAACCTKSNSADCIKEIAPVYDIITQAENGATETAIKSLTQKALGIIRPVARKYLKGAETVLDAAALLGEPDL